MSVTLQIKLNGGAPQTGGVTGAIADVVQLTAANKSSWSGAARWEIYDYPETFVAPAGWSTDGDGTIYVVGNADPGPFTIAADEWSKFGFRLTATDGGVVTTDESTALCVPHPTTGVRGIFAGESTQFGGERERWVKDMKADVRALVAALASPTYTSLTLDDGTDTLSLVPGTTANITANKSLELNSGTATGDITLDSANDINLDVTGPLGYIRAKLESVTKLQAEVTATTVELNGAAGVAVSLYSADNLGLASDVDVVVTAGQFFYATSVDNCEITSTTQDVHLSASLGDVRLSANSESLRLFASAGAMTLAPQNAALTVQPTAAAAGVGKAVTVKAGSGASGSAGGVASLIGGDGVGTNIAAGDALVYGGTPTGSGAVGGVRFGNGATYGTRYRSEFSTNYFTSQLGGGHSFDGSGGFSYTAGSAVTFVSSLLKHQGAARQWANASAVNVLQEATGSVTISSATTTTVASHTTESNRVYQVLALITVSNDTDNEGAVYWLRAAFKNVAGTMTQIGATQTIAADLEDAGQTGLAGVLDFSGTAIRARLTTDAADTVNANAVLHIYERVLA